MGPIRVKLMPSEYCFNLLDTITLVYSMISKRFFEGIAIYLHYTFLKLISYDFTLVSEVLFLRKPFSNFMRMRLNLLLIN